MPAIIDKEKMRKDILMAFERCIEKKPLLNISLRDIAKEAGMTHPKLLNYFESRDNLIRCYCKYTQSYMSDHCKLWFDSHDINEYKSKSEYLNAFLKYVADFPQEENRPNATTQFYVLAKYDSEIKSLVEEEFRVWRCIMGEYLKKIFGEEVGDEEAEGMMILISGIFICHNTGALTGSINSKILSSLTSLDKN